MNRIEIEGHEILEEIINDKKQVVFVSGHLSNFELVNHFHLFFLMILLCKQNYFSNHNYLKLFALHVDLYH